MDKNKLLDLIKVGHGITHSSVFHADDVFSTALLKLINPKFNVERLCNVPDNTNALVFDIGRGEYDHHQTDKEVRLSGIPYAAFGLLWRDLGTYFMDKEHADFLDEVFISEIDRCDNSSDTNFLSSVIGLFNPSFDEISPSKQNKDFIRAVNYATPILKNLINHFKKSTFVPRYVLNSDEYVYNALEIYCQKNNLIIDKEDYPTISAFWEKIVKEKSLLLDPTLFINSFIKQLTNTYGPYKTSPFIIVYYLTPDRYKPTLLYKAICEKIKHLLEIEKSIDYCKSQYESGNFQNGLLILDKYVPSATFTSQNPHIKAVAFVSDRGGYTLMGCQKTYNEKLSEGLNVKKAAFRFIIPSEYRQNNENLNEKFHIIFALNSGNIISCESLSDIINLYNNINS